MTWLTLRHWLQAWKAWWAGSPDPVPEPVPASPPTSEPVPEQDWEQDWEDWEIRESLKPKPPPDVQAQALLDWLQERYPGHTPAWHIPAWKVEGDYYPQLLDEKGWQQQPWVGRRGVGKYLRGLTGGRKRLRYEVDAFGERERVRTYLIPQPQAVVVERDARHEPAAASRSAKSAHHETGPQPERLRA